MNEIQFSDYHAIVAYELREAVGRYFAAWELLLEKHTEEHEDFASSIEQPRLSVVVLSAVLVECSINFYLSTKCDANELRAIGNLSLEDKWCIAPKWFAPGYRLSEESGLPADLKKLIQRRNRIVHNKPFIAIDGKVWHKGYEPKITFDEHDFVGRSVTLPLRLVDNLLDLDATARMSLSSLRTYVGMAAGSFGAGERKLSVHRSLPKTLIQEIMEQGYARETAIRCAILLGDDPKVDEDGKMTVWLNLRRPIKLEPLRFFQRARK